MASRILKQNGPHPVEPPMGREQFKPWTVTMWVDGQPTMLVDLNPSEAVEVRTDPVTKSVSIYVREVPR